MGEATEELQRTVEALGTYSILLGSDPSLPSVASVIVGEPVGRVWGHPQGEAIWRASEELAHHPKVLVTKLVSGKVTYVHQRLWPAVLAVARASEPWQVGSLSRAARSLLEAVTRNGEVRTDQVPRMPGVKAPSPGDAARELERRLLVHSQEVHTSTGAHAKYLETWDRWANRVGFRAKELTVERAKETIEEVLAGLNRQFGARGRLPWNAA